MKRMITVESFGADCPKNWEEIADFLNEIIEEHEPAEDEREENDWHANLWERYCRGEIPGAPEAIMEKQIKKEKTKTCIRECGNCDLSLKECREIGGIR